LDHGKPVVGSSFPAGRDAPPVAKPAICPFDGPAFAAERVGRLGSPAASAVDERVGVPGFGFAAPAAAADHRFDAACAQLPAELLAVVAAVGPELEGPQLACQQLVEQRQQVQSFVLVAGADPDRKRRPGRVDC
jgi:hypothetical protein